MTCEGCVNDRCLDCRERDRFVREVERGTHKPSAWERRWNRWAKKQNAGGKRPAGGKGAT